MFRSRSVQGQAIPRHRRRHGTRQDHDGALRRARRRLRDLRPPRRRAGGDRQGDHGQASGPPGRHLHAVDIRVATAVEEMIERDLGERAARRIGQQCCRKLHLADQGSQPARLRRHRQHRPARHVLHDQRLRQALDRRAAQGERAQHPHDLGMDRQPVRRALGDVQGGRRRDDPEPGRRMGPPRHPPQRHRARPLPDRRRVGAAQSDEGRRRRPLQGAQPDGPRRPAAASSPTWRRS